jgi:hypothetical protein
MRNDATFTIVCLKIIAALVYTWCKSIVVDVGSYGSSVYREIFSSYNFEGAATDELNIPTYVSLPGYNNTRLIIVGNGISSTAEFAETLPWKPKSWDDK